MFKRILAFTSRYYPIIFILFFVFICASSALLIGGSFQNISGVAFFASVYGMIRIITFRKGSLPLISRDLTWIALKSKEKDEDLAEEKYKTMSLKHSVVSLMVSTVFLIVALALELLKEFNS